MRILPLLLFGTLSFDAFPEPMRLTLEAQIEMSDDAISHGKGVSPKRDAV